MSEEIVLKTVLVKEEDPESCCNREHCDNPCCACDLKNEGFLCDQIEECGGFVFKIKSITQKIRP